MRIAVLIYMAMGVVLGTSSADQTAEGIVRASGVKGGVVVHIGDDTELTAALRLNDQFIVQGLRVNAEDVKKARKRISSSGDYGPVSIAMFDGENLPYAENMANLVVISHQSSVTSEEVGRVLVPNGVVLSSSPLITDHRSLITLSPVPEGWHAYRKPLPSDIDTWSHHLHGADNNAVAMDKQVDTPQSLKWVCKPLWSRSHEFLSSISAMVSDGGRIFYVVDEGLTAIHTKEHSFEKWMLTARDAFNGKLLWKKQIEEWGQKGWKRSGLRSTPSDAPKRLVIVGDVLYITLGYTAPVSAVDAASGEILRTYAGTENTKELRVLDGVLLARTNQGLIAIDSDSGKKLWVADGKIQASVTAAADERAFYVNGKQVVSCNLRSGKESWASNELGPIKQLLVHDEYLLVAGGKLSALKAESGEIVWSAKAALGKSVLFAANGQVWAGATAYSLETGNETASVSGEDVISVGHHPRCYPQKATERFLITPHRGTEFMSLTGGKNTQNDWVRGPCTFGVLPCNGLLYVGPNPCFCYPGVKITGLNALAGKREVPKFRGERLEKGKAFGKVAKQASGAQDWPAYRSDSKRTGGAGVDVPTELKQAWKAGFSGKLTQPVIANGKVFVAEIDSHTLHALDEGSGRLAWSYVAGGRIDSSPTVHKGLLLLGSADGRVHCLRADDGELVWRFLAAPSPRQIMAFDQLESPWRVHGSVLVVKNTAYVTAGRSTNLDGGIRVYGLNAETGEVLHTTTLHSWSHTREDVVGKPVIPGYAMEGAFSDVLVSEGGYIHLGQYKMDLALNRKDVPYIMRNQKASAAMDVEELKKKDYIIEEDQIDRIEKVQHDWQWKVHPELMKEYDETYGGATMGERSTGRRVFSTGGFLDDSFFNRTFWMYSAVWPGFYVGNRGAKSGHLLVVDDKNTYAMSAFPGRNIQSAQFFPGEQGYLIKADSNESEPVLPEYTRGIPKGIGFTRTQDPVWHKWVPILVRAMTVTDNALFIAGAPDELVDGDLMASFEGRNGAVLRAMSKKDGAKLSELKLEAPPVFDGMAAANGRLYMALANGELVCFGE